MKTYELTYIISASLPQAEVEQAQKDIQDAITQKGGVIVTSANLGAQPLAYPIKKQGSGYFHVVVFQMEEATLLEFKGMLEKNTTILRHALLIKHPAKVMKERRTRKPVPAGEFEAAAPAQEQKPVDEKDLNKKLDEMLGG